MRTNEGTISTTDPHVNRGLIWPKPAPNVYNKPKGRHAGDFTNDKSSAIYYVSAIEYMKSAQEGSHSTQVCGLCFMTSAWTVFGDLRHRFN